MGQCNISSKFLIQHESETTLATPLYYASTLLWDRAGWHLDAQEIKLSPWNTK